MQMNGWSISFSLLHHLNLVCSSEMKGVPTFSWLCNPLIQTTFNHVNQIEIVLFAFLQHIQLGCRFSNLWTCSWRCAASIPCEFGIAERSSSALRSCFVCCTERGIIALSIHCLTQGKMVFEIVKKILVRINLVCEKGYQQNCEFSGIRSASSLIRLQLEVPAHV